MMEEVRASAAGSEMVYRSLRRDILKLDLRPGSELDEGIISTRYRVSRTPVREALIRLTAEGLVTSAKGRGARVAALELQNLRDFFEGIDILQRAVTRLAAIRRRPTDLAAIEMHMLAFEGGARSLDSETVNEKNYAFHTAIGEAAQSSYLSRAYQRSLLESLRIAYVCFSEHSGVDEKLETHLDSTMQDHRAMFDSIRTGDPDAAEAKAGSHVELFRNRIVTAVLSTDVARRISVTSLGR